MTDGTVSLHRYANDKVRLACRTCPRAGQFTKAALIERVGPDESLPELRLKIAAGWGCETARLILASTPPRDQTRCGIGFPDLIRPDLARQFFRV